MGRQIEVAKIQHSRVKSQKEGSHIDNFLVINSWRKNPFCVM